MLAKGADWQIGLGPDAATGTAAQPAAGGGGGKGFGSFLTEKVGELSALQDQAAQGAQALASGQATDPTQVVMAVEDRKSTRLNSSHLVISYAVFCLKKKKKKKKYHNTNRIVTTSDSISTACMTRRYEHTSLCLYALLATRQHADQHTPSV